MAHERICQCELSGYLHLVTFSPRTCCELCTLEGTEEMTPHNVRDAFKWCQAQMEELNREVRRLRGEQS